MAKTNLGCSNRDRDKGGLLPRLWRAVTWKRRGAHLNNNETVDKRNNSYEEKQLPLMLRLEQEKYKDSIENISF